MSNETGIIPKGYSVLVRLDPVADEIKHGSLVMAKTESATDADSWRQTNATLIALGPLCWADEVLDGKVVMRAQIGEQVLIKEFAGISVKSKDALDPYKYRICMDKDIYATKG